MSHRVLVTVRAWTFCLLVSLLAAGTVVRTANAQTKPLLQKNNLTYRGAFRLPEVPDGGGYGATHGFDYATSGFAYCSAHNSLFINNHVYEQKTAEVSIPQLSIDMNNLNRSSFLQIFADITEGNLSHIGAGGSTYGGDVRMGGLMVYGNKLIGTAYGYYDAGSVARLSHFTSGLTLSTKGDFRGMYQVGTMNPGFVAGYMGQIPQEWQAALGGPALTGLGGISIISRSSYGPAAFVFNPDDLGVKKPVPATPLVYYDQAHPTLGDWGSSTTPNLYFNMATNVQGIVFPAGTSSVLFFGRQGTGNSCYGEGTSDRSLDHKPVQGESGVIYCYDPAGNDKGCHAYPYKYWVWAYDVNDLISVKNGQQRPWQVVPYAIWSLDMPLETGSDTIQGMAYDHATQRIYISQALADGNVPGAGAYDRAPVVQVFEINNAPPITPTPTPTATPTRTPTPTPTATPTRTLKPTPTATATPSPRATPTRTPTPTPSVTPTRTPTPTPTARATPSPTVTPSLYVTVRLSQVSGHSVIICTVKNNRGRAVASQKVSVQMASTSSGPYAVWMSKLTNAQGQALFPYAKPKNSWYVRCAAAGNVSESKLIVGSASATAARKR